MARVTKYDFVHVSKTTDDDDKGLQAQAFSFSLDGPMVRSVVDQGEFKGPSPPGLEAWGYADIGNWP